MSVSITSPQNPGWDFMLNYFTPKVSVLIKKCVVFGKKRTCRSDNETFGQFFFMENLLKDRKPTEPSKTETIVKRKFTDNEIERNYKNRFFSMECSKNYRK